MHKQTMVNFISNHTLRVAAAALSVAICLLYGCAGAQPEETRQATVPVTTEAETLPSETTVPIPEEGAVSFNGKYYRLQEDQLRILIMGLDKKDHTESASGYTNRMQSDFLLLAVLDKNTKECDILNLNRDLMTKIQKLGFGGSVTGSYTGQLALAHTHGRGGSDSAKNVVWSVSHLLGGIPIDHYMRLSMASVSKLNDLVGGVTVTVLEDMSSQDYALVKGKEVTLTGRQAMIYVRGRMNVGDGTNLGRMERQEQYMYAFYRKFMEKVDALNVEFLTKLLVSLGSSFHSDLDFEGLKELWNILPDCKLNPFQSVQGELVRGEKYYEFYADEEALQAQVIDLFYEEIVPKN